MMAEKSVLLKGGDFEVDAKRPSMSTKRVLVILGLVLVLAAVVVAVVLALYFRSTENGSDISASLKVDNIMDHLYQLNDIADKQGGGSRSVVDAYNASADYVAKMLADADFCDVERQYFMVPLYVQLAPPTLTQIEPLNISYVVGRDFSGTRYGGNGNFSITGLAVVAENYGCNPEDFSSQNFVDQIAVVFDGNCTQYQKALNAEQASAKAILLVNAKGNALANWRVRSVGWNESTQLVQIPVLGLTYSLGLTLQAQNTTLSLTTATKVTVAQTYNVLCLTRKGTDSSIIVMGSHLDGVPEGPGINDNGSGSSSVLEIVLQMARSKLDITNKILFSWWGAEEIGLLGSRAFVNQIVKQTAEGAAHFDQKNFLPSLSLNNTLLNLNFDMLGSPNFIRQVYRSYTAGDVVNNASSKIEKLFEEFFNKSKIPYQTVPMSGGSDYLPFIEAGIPAGALATGAGALKTTQEREIFGGLANAPLDPCYHLACDTTWNINKGVLQDMSKAAAYVVQKLAQEKELRRYLYEKNE